MLLNPTIAFNQQCATESTTTNDSFDGSHLLTSTPCHGQQISLSYNDSAKLNVSGSVLHTSEQTHHVIPGPMSTPKLILSNKIVAIKNSNTTPKRHGKTICKGKGNKRHYQRSCTKRTPSFKYTSTSIDKKFRCNTAPSKLQSTKSAVATTAVSSIYCTTKC